MKNQNDHRSLLEETRRIVNNSLLREHLSNKIAQTLLIVEEKIKRELTQDEIENIFILLADENNI
jgi:hypothetical protein